ncbi:MAG: BrnT family toxin [Acidobacteriota bacterium]
MFEWDPKKAAANLDKHGVSFDEAATTFADPGALDGPDVGHSTEEPRFLRVGRSILGQVLVVAYTQRKGSHGEAIRIISARRASRKERTAHGRTVED